MNPKLTLGLVIFLVALGGYVYFFEIGDTGDSQVVDADEGQYQIYGTTYTEYDIVELEVAGPQGVAHFARTNDTPTQDWAMVQPTFLQPAEVDQARVNGAATRLGRLTAGQVITAVTNLEQYGLMPPELTLTLTISDGQKIILLTGGQTPVDDNRYLRTPADDETVYLVISFAVDDAQRLIDEPPLAPTPLPTITPTVSP